jgi:hypothetical protein
VWQSHLSRALTSICHLDRSYTSRVVLRSRECADRTQTARQTSQSGVLHTSRRTPGTAPLIARHWQCFFYFSVYEF